MKVTFVLPLKAIVKHSVRYGRPLVDARDPAMFSDVYVKKDALRAFFPNEAWPTKLTFTVEVA